MAEGSPAPRTLEAWNLVRTMLDNLTAIVLEDAETEMEAAEGLRVLARVTALCSEISLDNDPSRPRFFNMNAPSRYVGGPNPDGEYHLCMIDGGRRYRIRGRRGSVTYLGFQVLAGRGLTPRRMAAHVSDRDLTLGSDGSFELLLSEKEPDASERGDATWVQIPDDASAIVVREYIADRAAEELASYEIETLEAAGDAALPSDEAIGEQLTAMAWTIYKLTTLHRTIMPELLTRPNELVTASAAAIGAADTTPDNLYMIGTFRLGPDEALVVDAVPPESRYWSLTLENIWHECIDVGVRRSSITNAAATRRSDGSVRFVISARPSSELGGHWLDTGGRHRGFVLFRWLDNPSPPQVTTRVCPI